MPVDGLSLVGFMEEQEAIAYLDERCVWEDASTAALRHHWNEARSRLGRPVGNAGHPEITELPEEFEPYLAQVRQTAGYEELQESFADPSFALVELGPLLAYQHHIETARAFKVAKLPDPSEISMKVLLEICLPLRQERYEPQVSDDDNGVTVRSDSLNLRLVKRGLFENGDGRYQVAGALMGMTGPLFHVARFNDRLYLRNGFHRAFALQQAGVRHIPSVIIDTPLFENTGALGGRSTFDRTMLDRDDPPTVAHYAEDRASAVRLRRLSKVITVVWREDIFVEP